MGLGRLIVGIPSWITRVNVGRVKVDKVLNHNPVRALTSIQPMIQEGDRAPRRKKLVAALGTVLTASGLALVYKAFYDEDFRLGFTAHCAEQECKRCEDSNCLRRMDKEEELIAKANQELEKALKDVKPKAQEATEAALKAYCEASELIKQFMDKAYCAIENDNLDSPQFEEVWCDVYETAVKRCEKVKDAMNKGQCAWELLCRLREVIENGKNCKYTQCNPLLITAEETLLCAERELLNAKNKMDCIQSESRLVEQYRNLVEDFRRDLKAELESLLAAEDCRSTFTENECAMVLTHAYKKVLRVQKELAQVQEAASAADKATNELLLQKIDEVKAHYEKDLVKALARQAQALQENYEAAKQVALDEYERKFKQIRELGESENLVDLRAKYNQATAALAAMENALKARQTEDLRAERFKSLWSYCNSLYNRINYAAFVAQDLTNDSISVNKSALLKQFPEDEFVRVLLKSIPEEVGSVERLRDRFFNKVDKVCRRVAVCKDDEKITLWKYLLGTVQASFTSRCEGESEDKNVYAILDRTALFLKRGDLLEAVCTLNQVEGYVPRKVCEDWIRDARSVLETNQTLFALMTHATANNLQS